MTWVTFLCRRFARKEETQLDLINANSPTFRKHEASNSEEFVVRELLCAIAAAYDIINVAHGKF